MADSAAGALLFGGRFGNVALDDTWVYAFNQWRLLRPATVPPARSHHALAFDERRRRTVLFGGHAANLLTDTWEFDGTNWVPMSPANRPPPRTGHAMAYDVQRERVVLFGGISSNVRLDDTWEWDGRDWTRRSTPLAPAPRNGHALTYDAVLGTLVLFGGAVTPGRWGFSDTWSYGTTLPASSRPFGSTCIPGLNLHALGLPWLGGSMEVALSQRIASAVALGASRTRFGAFALPLDLGVLGMPGCLLLTSSDLLLPAPAGSVAFVVPDAPVLTGQAVFVQGVAPAPGLNPAGLGVTGAVELVFGER